MGFNSKPAFFPNKSSERKYVFPPPINIPFEGLKKRPEGQLAVIGKYSTLQ